MNRIAEWIVKRRFPILSVILLLTVFFGAYAFNIEMYTAFSDLLPKDHPYIRVHNEFQRVFGGANVILLSLEVKEGDIFNPKSLGKIKRLTEMVGTRLGPTTIRSFPSPGKKSKTSAPRAGASRSSLSCGRGSRRRPRSLSN